ncbi:hypothetical protein NL676_005719 [Syzygium grande]|nr:hypothetical protein NL676_005719 [Syzygium grande]
MENPASRLGQAPPLSSLDVSSPSISAHPQDGPREPSPCLSTTFSPPSPSATDLYCRPTPLHFHRGDAISRLRHPR